MQKSIYLFVQASKVSTFSYSGDPLGVVSSGISKLYSTLTSLALIHSHSHSSLPTHSPLAYPPSKKINYEENRYIILILSKEKAYFVPNILTSLTIIFTNRIYRTKAILLCRDILIRAVTICEILITDSGDPANAVASFATKFLADLAFAWSQFFDFFVQFPVVNTSFELADLSRENLTHIR